VAQIGNEEKKERTTKTKERGKEKAERRKKRW
jgi:hypothetical protein